VFSNTNFYISQDLKSGSGSLIVEDHTSHTYRQFQYLLFSIRFRLMAVFTLRSLCFWWNRRRYSSATILGEPQSNSECSNEDKHLRFRLEYLLSSPTTRTVITAKRILGIKSGFVCLFWRDNPPSGPRPPHLRGFYITHNDAPQSVGFSGRMTSSSQRPLPDSTQHSQQTEQPCLPVGFEPAIPASELLLLLLRARLRWLRKHLSL
jgi:hypothetical protein